MAKIRTFFSPNYFVNQVSNYSFLHIFIYSVNRKLINSLRLEKNKLKNNKFVNLADKKFPDQDPWHSSKFEVKKVVFCHFLHTYILVGVVYFKLFKQKTKII